MSRKKEDRKLSTRLKDTHIRIVPFLNETNSRYLIYCHCTYHPGFLRLTKHPTKSHCSPLICRSYSVLPITNSHEYSPEMILQRHEELERELTTTNQLIPLRILPRRDEKGREFFWVRDSGNFLYFLRPKMEISIEGVEPRVPEVERDHFQLYLSRN